jgi:hypothetical protein
MDVARARLGDALRGRGEQIADGHHLSPVLAPAGLDRGGLGPILDGHTSAIKDVAVDEERLVNQGSLLVSRGGPGAIYGRAHDSVTALYSLGTDGQRTDWPIYDDPRTGERYFAVAANTATLADIVAEAPTETVSLKVYFDMWFNPPPRPPSR